MPAPPTFRPTCCSSVSRRSSRCRRSRSQRCNSDATTAVDPTSTADRSAASMHPSRANNPLFGPNQFKLGVFSANCDGGLTMSLAPERWPANWDDIAAMCQIADRAGMEFILPVAKWRGYQGKANIYGRSFETMTHSAAIGALTKQIACSRPSTCRWSRRHSRPRRSPPSITSRMDAPASTSCAAGTRRNSTCTASDRAGPPLRPRT